MLQKKTAAHASAVPALTGEALVQRLNATKGQTGALLGQNVLEASPEEGTVKIAYAPDERFCNPMGIVQGGFIAAMLDDASAIACIVAAQAKMAVPTLEMKISYFHAVRPGPVIAIGRVIKAGRSVTFLGSDLYDMDGKRLAQATATAMPQKID